MFGFLDDVGHSVMDAVRPYVEPVDPALGSQGAPRAGQSDGSLLGDLGQGATDLGRGLMQEGFMGIFDLPGMLDRQAAQRELAANFNIVPEGTPGIRSENQVTEAEFERIAETYSDIRLGRSDLQINLPAGMDPKDADAYRQRTMQDIGQILQTDSGRDLIGQLSHNEAPDGTHRVTSIAGNDPDPQNATTNGNPGALGTPEHPGAGGNSTVTYNPGSVWTPAPRATNGEPWLPMRSDVQLFHELTHSLNQTHGTVPDEGMVTDAQLDAAHVPQYDDARIDVGNEKRLEHQAAGIGEFAGASISENAYRRDRARIAALHGPGIVGGPGGDVGIQQRTTYGEYGLGDPVH